MAIGEGDAAVKTLFSFGTELLRVIVLLLLGMYLLWIIEMQFYGESLSIEAILLLAVTNFLVLFILYRNKWQFSGWFKSTNAKKLPPALVKILWIIIVVSLLLIVPLVK